MCSLDVWGLSSWREELRVNLRAFDFPEAHMGDLENPIHPLFLDLEPQPGFHPALRYASRHLTEPKLLNFWHALLFSKLHELPDETEAYGMPAHELQVPFAELTTTEVRETQVKLVQAAANIHWGFLSRINAKRTIAATTMPIEHHDAHRFEKGRWNNPPGFSCLIRIAPELAAVLYPTREDVKQEERLRVSFLLGRTLLHELAHALHIWNVPLAARFEGVSYGLEPYLETQRVPELGWAYELYVFGGTLQVSHNEAYKTPIGLKFSKSVDPQTWVRPTANGWQDLARRKSKPWSTEYAVPMDFIQKQFTTAFWEGEVRANGRAALRFKRTYGYRFIDCGRTIFQDAEKDWPSDDESMQINEDHLGLVRPGQPPRLFKPTAWFSGEIVSEKINRRLFRHFQSFCETPKKSYAPRPRDWDNNFQLCPDEKKKQGRLWYRIVVRFLEDLTDRPRRWDDGGLQKALMWKAPVYFKEDADSVWIDEERSALLTLPKHYYYQNAE